MHDGFNRRGGFILKHADLQNRKALAELGGALRASIARAGRIQHKPESRCAGLDRRFGVLPSRDSANFYHHGDTSR